VYGGKPSGDLLPAWKRTEKHQKLDDGRRRHAITHADPATGLEVTCDLTLYADFPDAEWVLTLRNGGSRDTPILQKVRPLDLAGELSTTGKLVLHYANGSTASPTDYQPFDEPLRPGADLVLASSGGRSSNGRFPFFNLDWGEGGLAGAIGWSGQWQLRAARDKQRGFQLQARQQVTHFLLHPGESVRTPRILLIGWQQDRLRGHNMLRRLIYRWHTPLLGKEKPLPPTQCNTWFPVGDNGGNANEKNQVELLEAYAGLGIEYLVMDAGWYGTSPAWWANVGTWVPRRDTFPRGLGPVGAAAKRAGIRFGLWFEPERVRPGSQLDREHPEWLLKTDEKTDRLLNLGLPEAQQWFVELISRYVEEVPLGYFRHDFNIDPLPFWTKADAPDRAGISEIRYVEGLYKVWDTLRTRHPRLMMEGCASGGRRIDLESITRFHTYWKADLYGNLLANQCHVYGANLYLPSNYFNTPLFDLPSRDNRRGHPYTDPAVFDLPDNPYAFRSLLGGALCCGWDPRIEGFDRDLARARIDRFKALRPLTVGDFYPLLPYSLERSHWMAYQFHRDDLQEGMALVFRRAASPYAAVDVALRGLEPERQYEVTCEGLAEPGDLAGRKTGHALGRKLRVTIDRAAGSALIRYRPVADE